MRRIARHDAAADERVGKLDVDISKAVIDVSVNYCHFAQGLAVLVPLPWGRTFAVPKPFEREEVVRNAVLAWNIRTFHYSRNRMGMA